MLLVGASLGANAVVAAGAEAKPPVDGVVSLSAPATFRLDAVSAAKRLDVPVLFAAGDVDEGGIYRTDAKDPVPAPTAAPTRRSPSCRRPSTASRSSAIPGQARTQVERFLRAHSG